MTKTTIRESKSSKAAKEILRLLLTLTPQDRLDALALVCNAWIEHKTINGLDWAK